MRQPVTVQECVTIQMVKGKGKMVWKMQMRAERKAFVFLLVRVCLEWISE
jgi:hypothetical protein